MGTTMASPHRKSKRRAGQRTGPPTRASANRRRAQNVTPRAAMVWALGFSLAAGLIDWLACSFTLGEFRRCGHLHIDVTITILALTLTGFAVHTWFSWRRARRSARSANSTTNVNDGDRTSG